MTYINAKAVKELASEKSGGKRVGRDFLEQVDHLVELFVVHNARKQIGDERKTITKTGWAERQIRKLEEYAEGNQ